MTPQVHADVPLHANPELESWHCAVTPSLQQRLDGEQG
jgi:hypothetical protein